MSEAVKKQKLLEQIDKMEFKLAKTPEGKPRKYGYSGEVRLTTTRFFDYEPDNEELGAARLSLCNGLKREVYGEIKGELYELLDMVETLGNIPYIGGSSDYYFAKRNQYLDRSKECTEKIRNLIESMEA